MIKPENQPLPFYTESLLSNFPEKMPPGPFPHTNLSGTENRSTSSLTQREAEKAISLLMGFEQTKEFIQTEKGYVDIANGTPTIVLINHTDNSCFDGDCFIKETLDSGKFMIGLRITPHGDSNSPIIPFVRINNPNDPRLIKNESDNIIGFWYKKARNGDKASECLFNEGDTVELFVDPKSIKKKMYNPNSKRKSAREQRAREKIALGGGFTMLLSHIDAQTNEVVTLIESTVNDVNIREIDDEKNRGYRFNFPYRLKLDQKMGLVPSVPWSPAEEEGTRKKMTTDDYINQGNLPTYLQHVVTSFVEKNGKALQKMASIALTLNPSEDLHAVKCHYATIKDEKGKPTIKTYAFNFESEESVEQWLSRNDKHHRPATPGYTRIPTNERLIKLINKRKAIWKEPSPSMRLNAIYAVLMGIMPEALTTSIDTINRFRELTKYYSDTNTLKTKFTKIIRQRGLTNFESNVLGEEKSTKKNPSPTKYLNQQFPWEFQLPENVEITHDYLPARVLGSLLSKSKFLSDTNNWESTTLFSNNVGSIETITSVQNPQKSFINLDIAGFNYTIPTKNHHVPETFADQKKISFLESVKVAKQLIEDWQLPVTVTEALIHSLREGD